MFAGFGSAEETNERYKFLLTQGNMGLSVAFDLPTLMGRDSDDPLALETQNQNLLAWFAFEETAFQLARVNGIDA